MKTFIPLAAFGASVLLALASPPPALAADNHRASVGYADLDLRNPEGVDALDRRIRAAVQSLCGDASDTDLEGRNAVRQCRAEIRAAAVAQRDVAIAAARRPDALAAAQR